MSLSKLATRPIVHIYKQLDSSNQLELSHKTYNEYDSTHAQELGGL